MQPLQPLGSQGEGTERRALLAIILCFLVIFVFQGVLFPPPPPEEGGNDGQTAASDEEGSESEDLTPEPGEEGTTEPGAEPGAEPGTGTGTGTGTGPGTGTGTGAGTGDPGEEPTEPVPTPEESFGPPVVSNYDIAWAPEGGFATRWTTRGAALTQLTLEEYLGEDQQDKLQLLLPDTRSMLLVAGKKERPDADTEWSLVSQSDAELVFETWVAPGRRVEKRVRPVEGTSYMLEVEVVFDNVEAEEAWKLSYSLFGTAGMVIDEHGQNDMSQALVAIKSPHGDRVDELEYYEAGDVDEEGAALETAFLYAGGTSKYFATVGWPVEPETVRSIYIDNLSRAPGQQWEKEEDAPPIVAFQSRLVELSPGERASHVYHFFVGPKNEEIIEQEAPKERDLPEIVDYGFFHSLSVFFLVILKAFHTLVPSWGLAIIILTLLVRLALHPLSIKSQRSMLKMQSLKPEMDKIREKFKNKKSREQTQKMNMELMELYKTHGVNPLGGCLPIVLQIPIFFGLYNTLLYAIELRQTKFLWIQDLSLEDRLFTLPFSIPILGTTAFNLLPILMMLAMILQQKLTPKPSDPESQRQQKIMMIVFVAFGFIFYTMPAGLVLYFLVSSGVGILQQQYIKKQLQTEGLKPKTA